ncbi:putative YceI-like family protein [Legionella moravica]|uniref:YceI-like family protein n=1 Tax=Legionella moravica TaxID=39962 RepID=A0A378K460_9GAMM|nr:YceI family protein [Legionella moravica]KTD35227.1 putative YceI-like family protein [Legionella moravica]STX62651.1 putative YceI-like family protein [Legionella moravica]
MKSGFYWIFGLLLVCFSYTVTAATSPQWDIVPEESELTFTGTQNNAPVTGSFKKFTGEIFVDPEHYKASSIHIVIDMTSITASYADITTTLEAPDWFDVKAFPKAEFKATQFNKIGEKTYEADGILTIRDKSAPVTLTFTAEESPKNHALVNGTASIKRSTFGVGQGEWASTDAIKDEVTVAFKITANRKN